MNFTAADIALILRAANFAAVRHRTQRRKGADAAPYINHPLEVAHLLWQTGEVRDPEVIAAAILHDTVEDTETTREELTRDFGARVAEMVMEVTDDKSLPKAERKKLQEEHAPHLSPGAKQIKLGDKISNIREIGTHPPADWSTERKTEYLDWGKRVVAGLRGANEKLEANFDRVLAEAKEKVSS